MFSKTTKIAILVFGISACGMMLSSVLFIVGCLMELPCLLVATNSVVLVSEVGAVAAMYYLTWWAISSLFVLDVVRLRDRKLAGKRLWIRSLAFTLFLYSGYQAACYMVRVFDSTGAEAVLKMAGGTILPYFLAISLLSLVESYRYGNEFGIVARLRWDQD